jgi:hypothetical protein
VRVIVSLLLVWHLSAVFLAPMSVPPSSQLVIDIAQGPWFPRWFGPTFQPMQWYLDSLYINHGYYFFAPDPGDGHLIYYDVYDAKGNAVKQGKFPDWDVQWPRLWYHRHFMLADQAGAGLPDEQGQRRFLEAYARQLIRQFKGESVRVRWVAHHPLDPFRASDPAKLDAPESYEVRLEVVQRRSDLRDEPPVEAASQQTRTPGVASGWIGVRR